MDQTLGLNSGVSYQTLSRCSWTAFVWPTLVVGFVLLVFGSIFWNLGAFKLFGLLTFTTMAFYILRIVSLLSRELFVDESGVWLQRGFFPWSKGIVGLKWRDLDEALFSQGVVGWIAKSHTVFVQHRFTQSNQLILPNMHRGDQAAMRINELHRAMIERQGMEDGRR